MKIFGDRSFFYRWELNQKIVIEKKCSEVHFANGTREKALCCAVENIDGRWAAEVPNILLQTAGNLHAYAWDSEKHCVVEHAVFQVENREKPDDYVYSQTEVKSYDKLVEFLEKNAAYYVPSIDPEGYLQWDASIPEMPAIPGANIRGPQGPEGPRGEQGLPGEVNIRDSAIGAEAWSSKNIVDRLCPPFAESGTVAVCEPVEGYPLEVVSKIAPVQSGSGDPYPPGGGKNLLGISGREISTDTNILNTNKRTFTGNQIFVGISADNYLNAAKILSYAVEDETVTLAATQIGYGIGFDIAVKPGETYTFSTAETYTVANGFYQADGTFISHKITEKSNWHTFTVPDNAEWVILVVRATAVNTETTFTNIQFEVGSTATSYAPYSNVRPISGWTSAKLWHGGKNLCPVNEITTATSLSGGITITYLPPGEYHFSALITKYADDDATNTRSSATIMYTDGTIKIYNSAYDSSNSERDGVQRRKEFTFVVDGAKQLSKIYINSLDYSKQNKRNAKAENIQIEPGTVASAYEPYRGEEFTLDLGQIVYGGSLNWDTGELTVDWASVNLGDIASKISLDTSAGYLNITNAIASDRSRKEQSICSHLKYHQTMEDTNNFWINTEGNVLRMIVEGLSTNEEYLAWITENNPTFAYPVTPTTVQLTPREILALAGTNTLSSDTGDTTVTGRADLAALVARLQETIAAQTSQISALQTAAISNA